MLERDGKCKDQVYGCDFGEQILLLLSFGGVPFIDVYPDVSCEIASVYGEEGP